MHINWIRFDPSWFYGLMIIWRISKLIRLLKQWDTKRLYNEQNYYYWRHMLYVLFQRFFFENNRPISLVCQFEFVKKKKSNTKHSSNKFWLIWFCLSIFVQSFSSGILLFYFCFNINGIFSWLNKKNIDIINWSLEKKICLQY